MNPIFFQNQQEFREWLRKNFEISTEVLVGYYKVHTKKPSMTWSESVDQALCFGWIDGIRRSIDDDSYCIRFTPRKSTSNWSNVNIKKVENLIKNGQMLEVGLKAFAKRKEEKSGVYSFENGEQPLPDNLSNLLKAKKKANDFLNKQPKSYQKMAVRWIMSAKRAETQLSRLDKLIAESEKGNRLFDSYKKT